MTKTPAWLWRAKPPATRIETSSWLPCAEQFRNPQQDEFIRISLEEVTPGAEGQVIVVADDDVITIYRRDILNREEGEGEAITRCIGRPVTAEAGATFRVPHGHQVNMTDLANKAFGIALRHIHQINPLEARR